nr:MAG TPA: hypothetical protein [Caudoviricetes sp.]
MQTYKPYHHLLTTMLPTTTICFTSFYSSITSLYVTHYTDDIPHDTTLSLLYIL